MSEELDGIGQRLRSLRVAQERTLEEVSHAAQMSVSTLSRLESGKRKATLELLVPLTRTLGVRIDELLYPRTPDPRVKRPSVTRAGMTFSPLTAEASPVQTYKVIFPGTYVPSGQQTHDGYEWLYVLSGKIMLTLGEREVILGRGEAAEFDTQTPHSIGAYGGKQAEVISIFNRAGARMHTHAAELDEDNPQAVIS